MRNILNMFHPEGRVFDQPLERLLARLEGGRGRRHWHALDVIIIVVSRDIYIDIPMTGEANSVLDLLHDR